MNDDEGILRRIDAARLNRRGRSKSEECADCDGRRRPAADGGYGLVDLFASYAYNDRASANFSVNNLLNKEHSVPQYRAESRDYRQSRAHDQVRGKVRRSLTGLAKENTMYIAMNRFKVIKGHEEEFERRWLGRDTYLDQLPGFVEFHLLRGPDRDDHTLYSSHTTWANKEAFENWTRSEQFRASHRNAGDNKPLHLGHPEFEGFEAIQTLKNKHAQDAAA
jgi:heme-degrading monooxygenase HmoA